ncbi:MAG TPA: hypothetical protein PLM53_16000 [Spirochaetota bacterium]|nr:hypothetical protein [Spirochaetota bacterium]HPC42904.1 hypothetical protein [Spirochaetota bacterium]HQF10004.1 hypothetical protein [Spirochaetota bacterium]HQH98600.1 hypothetical protein [Spirochaetota bacterium]HQJ72076.1 hypothetical protein [Spirochaetota bacterium]
MDTRHPAYRIFNILIIIALAGLPALFSSGCATAGIINKDRKYKQSSVKTFSSIEAVKSAEPIDRHAASMIYFKLDTSVDALSISITAEHTADIMGTKKVRKTYFVVEKAVDMSHFKLAKNRIHYAELGRNFDPDWNREKEITLVSKKTVPFRELDGNSVYRIRFTTFSTEPVDYTVRINADCSVTFMDTID